MGRRRDSQPCNTCALSFLKQHKINIRRLHAYWGASHPNFAIIPQRTGSGPIKKKIRSPVRNRFGIEIPRNTREALIIDKEKIMLSGLRLYLKSERFSFKNESSMFTLVILPYLNVTNGNHSCGFSMQKRKKKEEHFALLL